MDDNDNDSVHEQSSGATLRKCETIDYCPHCTMPCEYCEFGPCYDKCQVYIKEHHPEMLNSDLVKSLSKLTVNGKESKDATASSDSKAATSQSKAAAEKAADSDVDDAKNDASGKTVGFADEDQIAPIKGKGKSKAQDSDSDSESDDSDSDLDDLPLKPKTKLGGASPAIKSVLISTLARQKHKHITQVRGLELHGVDLKKAAKSFSKKFACSASVTKLQAGGNEIAIQGDVTYDLPDFILQEFDQVPKAALFFFDPKTSKKTRCI